MSDPNDILTPSLHLEQSYYTSGYNLGLTDGERTGTTEGRRVGLETAFQKFSQLGQLHGLSLVLHSRLDATASSQGGQQGNFLNDLWNAQSRSQEGDEALRPPPNLTMEMAGLKGADRVERHISALYALTELESLSIENNEDAVSEFDDRYRRAVNKAGIIGRITGERMGTDDKSATDGGNDGEGEVEDIVYGNVDRRKGANGGKQEEMEIEIR